MLRVVRSAACRVAAVLPLLGGACTRDAPPPPEAAPIAATVPEAPVAPDDETLATARQAADGLSRELMGLLLARLEADGPAEAIAFCADSAQARTAALSTAGVLVRRVTARPRNLANAPDAWEEEMLDLLASRHASGTLPPDTAVWVGAEGERELRYLRPIVVQQRCLACHGDPATFDPAVAAILAERYPEDRATGYAAGDFRGAVSVRLGTALP